MNNQDFKKLLRESIEARTDELEEGRIKDFFNKISPAFKRVKGLTSSKKDPIEAFLEMHAKKHFEENGASSEEAKKQVEGLEVSDKIRVVAKKVKATPGDTRKALETGVTLLRDLLTGENSEDQEPTEESPEDDDTEEVEASDQGAQEESKKNTSQPRLHESHQKERDEEIYNKLMKRLNNQ